MVTPSLNSLSAWRLYYQAAIIETQSYMLRTMTAQECRRLMREAVRRARQGETVSAAVLGWIIAIEMFREEF